jgi:xanthine dehydrogenase accessory factor
MHSSVSPIFMLKGEIKMIPRMVLFKGAGDLATGIAHRLWNAGFDPVMLELAKPLVVRRTVSFASAVYEKSIEVESVTAKLCPSVEMIDSYLSEKYIPVLIDPEAITMQKLKPKILIDARMTKANDLTSKNDAELVIAIGPGFTAGVDCHVVIETERGHNLGRVIYKGKAAADTGEPGAVAGYAKERLLRAPTDGKFIPLKKIGDSVMTGEITATVEEVPIHSAMDGIVRGMLFPELTVSKGMKVGDIDPRGERVDFRTISDKARSLGGSVLEVILHRYFFIG